MSALYWQDSSTFIQIDVWTQTAECDRFTRLARLTISLSLSLPLFLSVSLPVSVCLSAWLRPLWLFIDHRKSKSRPSIDPQTPAMRRATSIKPPSFRLLPLPRSVFSSRFVWRSQAVPLFVRDNGPRSDSTVSFKKASGRDIVYECAYETHTQ